jgi:hypothetical protein
MIESALRASLLKNLDRRDPSNLPSHATMVVSDHLNFTLSLPQSGHVTVPCMSRITIACLPLLNDLVVVAADLGFDQLAK